MSELPTTGPFVGDPLIGRVMGDQYRIIRNLASGGMGRVYLAEQVRLGRTVAVKVMGSHLGGDTPGPVPPSFRDWFNREAKTCSRLTHPNTIRVFDYGRTDDDIYFIAMEYVEGPTLSEILHDGPLDPLRTVSIASQVCASLSEAHLHGLVHRDLKPDNLIVQSHPDGSEFVKVLDFGIAKDLHSADAQTLAGVIYGSPGYMSPEQIFGQLVTPRSDIYAIGALLYRMSTGHKPFPRVESLTGLSRQADLTPAPFSEANPNIEVHRTLEWVTLQCLAKDAADRFASTAELARALKVCELESRGILAPLERLPGLVDGNLVLEPAVEDLLQRFGGASRSVTSTPPEEGARERPTLPTRLRTTAVVFSGMVVLGGMAAVIAVPILVLAVWWALPFFQGPAGDIPPVAADPAPILDAPETLPPPPPPVLVADEIEEELPPSTPPRLSERARTPPPEVTRASPPSTPAGPPVAAEPTPVSAPAPAAVETDEERRTDLRNPFARD